MNVVQLLFTLRSGRHSPAEALVGLGLRVAKSGRFPFLCFLLSPGNGAARLVAGADTPKPGWAAHRRNAAQVVAWAGVGLRYSPVLCSKNKISMFSTLFMLFALCMLISCNFGNKSKLPKPPFKTPVSSLSYKGVVADFDIRITSYNIYDFKLRFEYPKEDRVERERVQNIIGDASWDKNNNLTTPGILTPVKLTIYKKQAQGEQIVYQKTENPYLTSGGSTTGYFAKTIGHCDLKRGEYRFVLESLTQPQEYASIPTKFHIGTEPKTIFIPINIDRSKTCPQQRLQKRTQSP